MANFAVSFIKDAKGTIERVNIISTDFTQFKRITKPISQLADKKFENIKIVKGKIQGTNGSIDRYNDKAIVILCRTKQGDEAGFCIASPSGQIKFCTEKEAIKIAKSTGIANGKLVSNSYVSAIKGEYLTVEKVVFEQKQEKKAEEPKQEEKKVIALKDYKYGLQLLKNYKPKNLKTLVSRKEWVSIAETWKNNIENHEKEFENCILTYSKAVQLLDSIVTSSMRYENFLAQILKSFVSQSKKGEK